MRVGL